MQKTKLLLIEDEEDICSLVKLQAEISGYKIHAEMDGLNGYMAIEHRCSYCISAQKARTQL